MKKANQQLNSLFCVAREMIPDHGEDCFYYEAEGNDFIIASFDGCGGSGSKKYENYSGKTGAYIASRAVCGGVKSWFDESRDGGKMLDYIGKALEVCNNYADKSGRIMGSLGKAFPTTAAIVTGELSKNGINMSCFWAGDSRCYLLDANGLHQLTQDDIDGQDAMSNLLNDGVMTNVISASSPFELHSKSMTLNYPCILLTATDGCFGYLKSPMEFEFLLIEALVNSKNPYEWHTALYDKMQSVAGDDFTLCAAVLGYKDFNNIKKRFLNRYIYMSGTYIDTKEDVLDLWEKYKKDYSMM